MKVKDLKLTNLKGIKIRIPTKYNDDYQGIKGDMILEGVWNAGVWLKKSMKEQRIYPLSINPKKVLDFEVIEQ